jgi:hypothetical protein
MLNAYNKFRKSCNLQGDSRSEFAPLNRDTFAPRAQQLVVFWAGEGAAASRSLWVGSRNGVGGDHGQACKDSGDGGEDGELHSFS